MRRSDLCLMTVMSVEESVSVSELEDLTLARCIISCTSDWRPSGTSRSWSSYMHIMGKLFARTTWRQEIHSSWITTTKQTFNTHMSLHPPGIAPELVEYSFCYHNERNLSWTDGAQVLFTITRGLNLYSWPGGTQVLFMLTTVTSPDLMEYKFCLP